MSAGYSSLQFDDLQWALPVGLDGSVYIENHFDAVAHAYVMIMDDRVLQRQFVGAMGALGVRYLFSEEYVRPYVGLELGYFQTFGRDPLINRVGLTPTLGLEWFFMDTWSLGARGHFTAYWMLNEPLNTSWGGQLGLSTWF